MKKYARKRAKQQARQRNKQGGGGAAARIDVMPGDTGATPETRAKLEEDPLHRMVAAGMVDSAGERAAEEIKCVFLAICRDVIGKTMRHGVYARGKFEISDDLAHAHADRYLPWCRAHRPAVIEATIDLVVERKPPRSGLILDGVADALADYANRFDRKGGEGDGASFPGTSGATLKKTASLDPPGGEAKPANSVEVHRLLRQIQKAPTS